VQWNGRVLQLQEPKRSRQVEIWQHLDGTVEVLGDGGRLAYQEISPATRKLNRMAATKARHGPPRNNKTHKPTKRQQFVLRPGGRRKDPRTTLPRAS
jgi:hypothetical protein